MTRTVEDMYPTLASNCPSDIKRSLLSPSHTAAAAASVSIAHAQLRHLISCPSQRGTVYYVSGKSILERNLLKPNSHPRSIIDIEFSPTCFTATAVGSNPTAILFAAGGYNSDLHVSLHAFPASSQGPPISASHPSSSKLIWRHSHRLQGRNEIVNSILFTPAILTDDTRRSPSDIRIAVGGNDAAVKLFEVVMLPTVRDGQRLQDCGSIKLETPVNHMSFSPDGRTLLCVGDTPRAYLFNISPGSTATFYPLAVYMLPVPPRPLVYNSPPLQNPPANFSSQACFSTAWSADGLKFAVASQEGQLCVWDVRSANPLLNFWTSFRRNSLLAGAGGRGRLGEWEWEDLGRPPTDDATNNGPDSGIRNVRFSAGEGGRELLVFTEHTSNIHIIDARTFDLASHSVLRFPDLSFPQSSPAPSLTPTETRTPSPIAGDRPRSSEDHNSPIVVQRSRSRSRRSSPVLSRSSSDPSVAPAIDNHQVILRSLTPPDELEPRHVRSGSPRPEESTAINAGPRPRSRSRSPITIIPSRSYSRSRSPPPVIIVPRNQALPSVNISPAQSIQDTHWSPTLDVPESRVRLDADGDFIERNGGVTDGIHPATRWSRHGGVMRPQTLRSFATEHGEGSMPLEAVAERVEPPMPQKPTHLAGLCFDPSGGWVYVASEGYIVEWRVRERAEGRTCWGSGAWA